ncbi:PD-(D/E)XK nuclease family protein [soil metagenome]
MKVVFGWHLDGVTYPETVSGSFTTFNSSVCGPSGLLNILENYFGLGAPSCSTALRIAQYLTALEGSDSGKEFFSASFAVDPWSTSKLLLAMRDQLIAAGWDGLPIADVVQTKTLANVENSVLATSTSDRLRRVIDALKTTKHSPFTKIDLIDASDWLPVGWQKVLERLREIGTRVGLVPSTAQARPGDLLTLQLALLKNESAPPNSLTGDGSLTILDADDEIQAAEVTAAWLSSLKTENLILINGDSFSMLNESSARHGLPRIGRYSNSPHRGILQILPLAFELAWEPFDPARALEFLSVPGGPIPRSLSWPLKDALRRQPGIGGPLWNDAWDQLRLIRHKQLGSEQPDENTLLDEVVESQIAEWKGWFDSVSRRDGKLTSANVELICRRVEEWARKRASIQTEYSLYHVAAAHAAELAAIVNGFGSRTFTAHQLRYVIDSVISEGANEVSHGAEASPWTTIEIPGQIWSSAGTVIWWNFASSQPLPLFRNSWSENELKLLTAVGIPVETAAQQTIRQARSWRAPLLNAEERLLLIRPRTSLGQPSIVHPVWDEIVGLFPITDLERVTRMAATFHGQAAFTMATQLIDSEQISAKSLPTKLRDWHVPPNLITPRVKESYTSLERMLGCPLSWTLEYQARMRAGSLQTMSEDERLIGDFAHAAIARLFTESTEWQPEASKLRILAIMEELLPQLASSLLLPGNSVKLRKTKNTIAESTAHLIHILNAAQLKVQACEHTVDTAFGAGLFGGSIDILLRTAEEKPAVLDLKWSRYPNTYRKKLIDGKALQLASYGWLMRDQDDGENFAPAAFYLLRQGRLFANNSDLFPAHIVNSDKPIEATWSQATVEYSNILNQLIAGNIVATGVIETTEDKEKSDSLIEPPCGVCNFAHFCGVKLLK